MPALWLLAIPIVGAPFGLTWWSKFGAPYRYIRKDERTWFASASAYMGNALGLFPGSHWQY